MHKFLLLFPAFLMGLLPAHPQSDSEKEPDFTGHFSARTYTLARFYWQESPYAPYQQQGEMRLAANGKWAFKKSLQGYASAIANGNPAHRERNRIWLNEAYLSYQHKPFFIRAGKQVVKWGNLTGYSAFDLANRFDYYDILDTEREKLGIWGAEGRVSKGKTSFQFRAFLPDNRSRLYVENNRWVPIPREIPGPDPSAAIPTRLAGSTENLATNLPLLGANFATEIGRFQLRFNWLRGNNDIPFSQVVFGETEGSALPYTVEKSFHPFTISGFQWGTWAGSWNLWGEVAHVHSRRMASENTIGKDLFTFVSAGTDRFWQLENPEQHFRLVVQLIRVLTSPATPFGPAELDHIFQTPLLTDTQWQLSYRWQLHARSVYDFASKGFYLEPGLTYKPLELLSLQVGASLLGGDRQSFFGYFHQNSRFNFLITYQLL